MSELGFLNNYHYYSVRQCGFANKKSHISIRQPLLRQLLF